jgi:hypothetical protein
MPARCTDETTYKLVQLYKRTRMHLEYAYVNVPEQAAPRQCFGENILQVWHQNILKQIMSKKKRSEKLPETTAPM